MTSLPFWNPIICIIAFVILIAIACLLRSRGQKKYKEDTAQTEIFLSGEEPPDAEQRHIKSHNIYWGFFQTLKQYYDPTVRAHTGIINDFILWLIAIAVLTAVILLITSLT
jgi:multicomponent Na+:H+ antiporter subunit D